MKLNHVVLAQGVRVTEIKAPIYLPAAIASLKERLGFVKAPTTVEEVLPANDLQARSFYHGRLEVGGREIVVHKLDVYPRLISVELQQDTGTTDDCDLVLDSLVDWHPSIKVMPSPRLYVSQLEVAFDVSLDEVSPALKRIGAMISNTAQGYGQPPYSVAPLQMLVVAMNLEQQSNTLVSDFRIERRVEHPYDSNVYFSQAPLRTIDHKSVLEDFERHHQKVAIK
jgi:hypothetical protein